MPGVTADTNIYISGYVFGGPPRRFIELAAAGKFRLDTSNAILNEILRVLRGKFQWNPEELREVEEDICSYTQFVVPARTLDFIKTDLSDNRILECAAAARSDFIVSGDTRHLLPIGSFEGIQMMTVANFLELLKQLES